MSEEGKIPCPMCDGKGEFLASGIKYAEGHSGPYCGMFPCTVCNGSKVVPAAMLEWIDRAREIRDWRRSQELTHMDVAERSGLRPSEVLRLEIGLADNTNWKELLKVDQ